MTQRSPDPKPKGILNWVSQVLPFAHGIDKVAHRLSIRL